MPTLRETLGRAVAAERTAAGLTQTELAARLGWTRDMLSKRERGLTPIAGDELPAVCRALGVPLHLLYARFPAADRRALNNGR